MSQTTPNGSDVEQPGQVGAESLIGRLHSIQWVSAIASNLQYPRERVRPPNRVCEMVSDKPGHLSAQLEVDREAARNFGLGRSLFVAAILRIEGESSRNLSHLTRWLRASTIAKRHGQGAVTRRPRRPSSGYDTQAECPEVLQPDVLRVTRIQSVPRRLRARSARNHLTAGPSGSSPPARLAASREDKSSSY